MSLAFQNFPENVDSRINLNIGLLSDMVDKRMEIITNFLQTSLTTDI